MRFRMMMRGGRWLAAVAAVLLAAGLLAPVTVAPAGAQTPPPKVDYDADDDGLIEVSSLAQLNAIRWDLDGDGTADVYPPSRDGRTGHDPNGARKIAAAFPDAATGMGCPADGCDGYELVADLDFDTNGNGQADSGDDYWNARSGFWNRGKGGYGWIPLIGGEAVRTGGAWYRFADQVGQVNLGQRPHSRARMFTAVFEGNGHTIANLYINDDWRLLVGLFGAVGPGAHVRNLGLTAPNADSRVLGSYLVGALAGYVEGASISGVWSEVDVSGDRDVGGLIGGAANWSSVVESYASGDVVGSNEDVGGLIGKLQFTRVAAVYATGDVDGGQDVGGLAGSSWLDTVTATYASGSVTVTGPPAFSGGIRSEIPIGAGLLGPSWHGIYNLPRANYATGRVSATGGASVGGLTPYCTELQWNADRTAAASYWDTQTSGVTTSRNCGVGYSTAQLQAPTGYTGIYSSWNVDIDGDGVDDDPWDFGSSSEYPVLKYCADKPGIDTADGRPYCPLQPWRQRGQPAPVVVSVAGGSDVVEGGSASFTVSASRVPSAGLDVSVTVAASGDFGVAGGRRTVTVPVSGSVVLSVATVDDSVDEADGSVSVTVVGGVGYVVGSPGAASVAVADDDGPPVGVDYDVDGDGLVEVSS
ncbi:MAG: hypothetical protein OXI97_13030, partial [Acidimicrobiaceae bacterium]|nr:hypothetical protein [Acidimicrobiaceae bacterium]